MVDFPRRVQRCAEGVRRAVDQSFGFSATQATKISLSIDAVIFVDGETYGVNTRRLDQANLLLATLKIIADYRR
jgi:hypothetical protein